MAGSTKMIIITSDEDVIRQFALNNNKNTHIIELDNRKEMTTTAENNNNNMIDLNFLAQLSGLNSNNDQVYKRALESSNHVRSKPVKLPKKSIDMICTVCGDRAIGYNYDALSCSSCKAFFRRNVHQSLENLRCLSGTGQCSVAHEIRRKCQKCRLARCLAMGMNKDFMLSEAEKQRRKKGLEENRNMTLQSLSTLESANLSSNTESLSPTFNDIDQIIMDAGKVDDNAVIHENTDVSVMVNTLWETLSVEDSIVIEKVQSAFLSVFQNDPSKCSFAHVTDRISALISWSQMGNQLALQFISFFRHIEEFEHLHADDRFILIKYNLFSLFPIYKCFYNNLMNSWVYFKDNEEEEQSDRSCMLDNASNGFRKLFITLIRSLVEIAEQDPTFLSFLLVIFLFSQSSSMYEDELSLKDPSAVARAQSYYTQILSSYMKNKRGEAKTSKQFIQLLTTIFRIQSAEKRVREHLRIKLAKENNLDIIGPLMQTFLHVS